MTITKSHRILNRLEKMTLGMTMESKLYDNLAETIEEGEGTMEEEEIEGSTTKISMIQMLARSQPNKRVAAEH